MLWRIYIFVCLGACTDAELESLRPNHFGPRRRSVCNFGPPPNFGRDEFFAIWRWALCACACDDSMVGCMHIGADNVGCGLLACGRGCTKDSVFRRSTMGWLRDDLSWCRHPSVMPLTRVSSIPNYFNRTISFVLAEEATLGQT